MLIFCDFIFDLKVFQLELPYILFETDAVWLRDPMEFFQNQTLIDDADIIVPIKGLYILIKLKRKRTVICFCYRYTSM